MNKITVKVIEPETIEVFSPDGTSCGKLNETEFLDLRCQIKKFRKSGFYVYYNANKIMIRKDGFMERTIPVFVQNLRMLDYLLELNKKK